MAEKKTKCVCKAAPCETKPAPVKVPTKKAVKSLAGAVRKAKAAYDAAISDLLGALILRETIKKNSPVIKKLAKASEMEEESLEKIGELGY